ncbi:MAG: alpha/beta hydrolase [Methyloprofundus sp.]|nr:alpha/beta hydrolase [Methyloprofundus sp.]
MTGVPMLFFSRLDKKICGLFVILLMSACSSEKYLMPTPSLYIGNNSANFEKIPSELQNNTFDLLYVTDRKPDYDESNNFKYGYQRSLSSAFGSVIIKLNPAMSWQELVAESQKKTRTQKIKLNIASVLEQGRYPETPYSLIKDSQGDVIDDPALFMAASQINSHFQAELTKRLAIAAKKEVFIYIHGVSNTFADAAYTLAELWHFSGRETVPIVYTWPAGHGGASGYAYDRESGEFTIFHLKQFLRSLASNTDIEKIHILAHSRGTDVISTALRELFIEATASGKDPLSMYRIANLILAAPDIDVAVLSQRMIAERVGFNVRAVTIYTSSEDKAIKLSKVLFSSVVRLGNLVTTDNPDDHHADNSAMMMQQLLMANNLSMVEMQGKSDRIGHSYFQDNPAVSSDLIMTLRYEARPGKENGRPLKPAGANMWIISDDAYTHSEYNAQKH